MPSSLVTRMRRGLALGMDNLRAQTNSLSPTHVGERVQGEGVLDVRTQKPEIGSGCCYSAIPISDFRLLLSEDPLTPTLSPASRGRGSFCCNAPHAFSILSSPTM